jgi:hypothetical protein
MTQTPITRLIAHGGRGSTVSFDSASEDRLTHMKCVFLGRTDHHVATSVLVRRALKLYSEHLDKLVRAGDDEGLQREARAVSRAAQADDTKVPPALLLTCYRAFGELRKLSQEQAAAIRAEGLRRFVERKDCE